MMVMLLGVVVVILGGIGYEGLLYKLILSLLSLVLVRCSADALFIW